MSILNDGKLAAIFGKTLAKTTLFGEAMTLRNRVTSIDADGVSTGAFTDYAIVATRTAISAYRREQSRIPDGVEEIIVYQYQALATPMRGGQIVCRTVTYEVLEVTPDPAAATWTLRVRPLA